MKKLYALLCFYILVLIAVVYITLLLRDFENKLGATLKATEELDAAVSKLEIFADTTVSKTKTASDTTAHKAEKGFDFIVGAEVKDGRAVAFMDSVKKISGIRARTFIYSSWAHSISPNSSIKEYGNDSVVIYIDERILKDFSDNALKGLITHELGHFYYRHTRGKALALWGASAQFREIAQAEADAFAIRFSGRSGVESYIQIFSESEKEKLLRLHRADEMFKKKFLTTAE